MTTGPEHGDAVVKFESFCREGEQITRIVFADGREIVQKTELARERKDVVEPGWETVRRVVDDMKRHVSGVEGAEDSPVARWARELREALGGDGRDHAADMSFRHQVDAKQLTHTKPEPPDSYCRLYADMAGRNGNARTPNGIDFGEFLRRCKALAERERGE